MGYRCPECKKDFGCDKVSFIEHLIKDKVDIAKTIKETLREEQKNVKSISAKRRRL